MATELLEPPQVVLLLLRPYRRLLLLLLLEQRNGALEPLGRVRIGRRVLAQHVGVAPQSAPARDDLVRRLIATPASCSSSVASVSSRAAAAAGEQAAPLAILERRGTRPGTCG